MKQNIFFYKSSTEYIGHIVCLTRKTLHVMLCKENYGKRLPEA